MLNCKLATCEVFARPYMKTKYHGHEKINIRLSHLVIFV